MRLSITHIFGHIWRTICLLTCMEAGGNAEKRTYRDWRWRELTCVFPLAKPRPFHEALQTP
jgi:hypothetical protein